MIKLIYKDGRELDVKGFDYDGTMVFDKVYCAGVCSEKCVVNRLGYNCGKLGRCNSKHIAKCVTPGYNNITLPVRYYIHDDKVFEWEYNDYELERKILETLNSHNIAYKNVASKIDKFINKYRKQECRIFKELNDLDAMNEILGVLNIKGEYYEYIAGRHLIKRVNSISIKGVYK